MRNKIKKTDWALCWSDYCYQTRPSFSWRRRRMRYRLPLWSQQGELLWWYSPSKSGNYPLFVWLYSIQWRVWIALILLLSNGTRVTVSTGLEQHGTYLQGAQQEGESSWAQWSPSGPLRKRKEGRDIQALAYDLSGLKIRFNMDKTYLRKCKFVGQPTHCRCNNPWVKGATFNSNFDEYLQLIYY